MKATANRLSYALLTYRLDQLWLPAALWALFALLPALFLRTGGYILDVTGGFLGIVLPLVAGILAAYAVLDDPALELHFASPRPAWQQLLERLGPMLGVLAVAAVSYQLFMAAAGIDLSALGSPAARQLAWLAPCLATLALGSACGFALAGSTAGALVVGAGWIAQLMLRDWFAADPVARYVFLFLGVRVPDSPALPGNQACLIALAALLLWTAVTLFKRRERYL